MAMEEQKYDTAMIFLNKILELDPLNLEAKLCKGEIYHRCLGDYRAPSSSTTRSSASRSDGQDETVNTRARAAMARSWRC